MRQIGALSRREEREATELFYVEGVRFVMSALSTGAHVVMVTTCPAMLTGAGARHALEMVAARGIPVHDLAEAAFRGLSRAAEPQGIGAMVRQRWHDLRDVRPGRELCWLVLNAVNSPGNLGTMLRTSEAVGGAGVILLGSRTDPHDPAAVRGTMGAIFTQKLVRATPSEFATFRKRAGMTLIGTSVHAAADYRELRYDPPLGLFMGCEQGGISPEHLGWCDQVVRIPMAGRCDSLNVAVAAGVVLYELYEKRETAGCESIRRTNRPPARNPCKSKW